MKEKLKNIFFKIWYWYISTIDKDADVIFMNFGYSKGKKILLKKEDEINRYSIQLYNHVVTGTEISGKNILEVGCGRGGGLSYVNRYFLPNNVTGIDLNNKAIKFCNDYYKEKNITFLKANAQNLPFNDGSFEVVINIESAHRYPQVDLFINEVYRILKPGGYFLFADFGQNLALKMIERHMENAKFEFIKKENITQEVIEALTMSTPERKVLINKLVPFFLRNLGNKFAATSETITYNRFVNGYFEYVYYVLKK